MAKTKALSLDLGLISDSFFEDRILLGISTVWSSIRFCWEMEHKLGINFERNLRNDIQIRFESDAAMGLGRPGTLFADIPKSTVVSFGVFEHLRSFSADCFYLYSNKEQEFALLPQFPQYSHFLLLPEECITHHEKPLSDWIEQLEGVEYCGLIDTNHLENERENLIL